VSTLNSGFGRLLAGGGGVLLLASLFLPWADNSNGASRNGWELSATSDVLFVIVGVCGIAAAITGGRFGFFRPDVSLNGATDILGVAAAIVLGWLILFDFPSDAGRAVGGYLALAGALAIACGAGDFRVTSLFPAIPDGNRPSR
jgi:hypothetical protein